MKKLVPIDLGGSPHRCAVAPHRRPSWDIDSIDALAEQTRERHPDAELEFAFFHGGFPSDEIMAHLRGTRMRLSCHPADLDRAKAMAFWRAGGATIELEALSFDPHVLRTCERAYTVGRVRKMASVLRDIGFQVGIHLVPGLPGQDVDGALADAEALSNEGSPWVDFVRIWPALGFSGAKLAEWAETGRWIPMEVDEAVNIVCDMVDIVDAQGIPVIRIGIQPGQDIPVKALAGPVHPNLRGRVESQRFAARLDRILRDVAVGSEVVIAVNPKDIHLAKGTSNINSRSMTHRYALASMRFESDTSVTRGSVQLARID